MTTTSASWTENQEHHASGSISAGASVQDSVDLDTNGYDLLKVWISIAFGGSPDGDCLVEIFPSYDSGTTFSSVAEYSQVVPRATSTTVIVSFNVEDLPYVRIKVTNNDTTDSVTYVGKYTGKEYSTA